MALTEETVIAQRNVLEDGQIWVLTVTKYLDDDVEMARRNHRHVVLPGADLLLESPEVRLVGEAVHTPEVIAAYEAFLLANAPIEEEV